MNFLKSISIRTQLLILSSIFLIIITVLGIKAIWDADDASIDTDNLNYSFIIPTGQIAIVNDRTHIIRNLFLQTRLTPEKRPQLLAQMLPNLKVLEETWKKYYGTPEEWAESITAEGEYERAQEINKHIVEFSQLVHAIQKYPNEVTEESTAIGLKMMEHGDAISALMTTNIEQFVAVAEDFNQELNESYATDKIFNLAFMIGALFIGLLFSMIVISHIRGALAHSVKVAQDIANKKLDDDIETSHPHTELGKLSYAHKEMQDALNQVLRNINAGSQQLSAAASDMTDEMKRVANSSHSQSEAASGAAAAVEQLTVSIDHVNMKANSTRDIAQEARSKSQESSAVIRKTSDQVQSIADTMQASVKLAENLGERSQQIDVIVNTIRDIADQTNLLALNAAIEAARAGGARARFCRRCR